MNCCTEYTNLGCFDSCDTIILPFVATESGVHTILITKPFYHKYNATFLEGDNFEIDLKEFAENKESIFQIIMPSGNVFTSILDDIQVTGCFQINLQVFGGSIAEEIEVPTDNLYLTQDDGFYLTQADGYKILI